MTIKLSSTNCVIFLSSSSSFFFFFNDTIIATLCPKSKRFNESMAMWFHESGSSIYIFLDDLPCQAE